MTETATVYTDESGNLPNPDDRFVALAALVTARPRSLRKIVKKASRKLKRALLKKRGGLEVKWYNSPDGTKRRVLRGIASQDVEVFWLVVDKEGESIADTPANYGLMLCELFRECLSYHADLQIVIDRHFCTADQQEQLNKLLCERMGLSEPPIHLDSQQDGIIQLADFVAGAARQQMLGEREWVELIEDKVVVGRIVKWRELRQKQK